MTSAHPSETERRSLGLLAKQQRLTQQLLRIQNQERRTRVAGDLFQRLQADVQKKKLVSIREVLRGPNMLLIGSLSLVGTAIFWILGDILHWLLGILFAVVGLLVSLSLTLRFAFNATILSPIQISASLRVLEEQHQNQQKRIAETQAELAQIESILALETTYDSELQRLQSTNTSRSAAGTVSQALDDSMRAELRKTGTQPTEKQIQFARHLGIPVSGQESREELSFAITLVTSQQTPEEELLSRAKWSRNYSTTTDSSRKACLDQIVSAIQTNKDCGSQIVRGFVLIRGSDCGDTHHGTFIRVKNALSPLTLLPPFTDCDPANCTCEIIPVLKGTTARAVLRGHAR
jgi:hypothetical protein